MVNGPCMYVTACFCVSRAIEEYQFGYRIFSMVGHEKARFIAKNQHSERKMLYLVSRGTSILGEVRNVEIPGPTQQLLCSKYHDFLAIFALAHSKINQIA